MQGQDRLRVLVVEDDDAVRSAVDRGLGVHGFDVSSVPDAEAAKRGEPRLLAVDNRIVIPVGTEIKAIVTSEDVIHSFAMPAFGLKTDAIPGRLNETWFKADKEGIYYGQCSILCGKSHGFMPIMVIAVSEGKFEAWTRGAKLKFAAGDHLQFASISY